MKLKIESPVTFTFCNKLYPEDIIDSNAVMKDLYYCRFVDEKNEIRDFNFQTMEMGWWRTPFKI